ncbi:RDD family protein [Empedobacter sedimenti]|uniref:RDD family protein n=1 Tax=Empedobacter sedimenti TaxID=3042610 RepID=UPI0024A675CB|nr:RDD family protein [Empedobacter sedimenti]
MKITQIVYDNKANQGLRFLNFIIDYLFIAIISYFLVVIIFLIKFIITQDLSIVNNLSKSVVENQLIIRSLYQVYYFIIIFFIEFLTKGRSLGKLITGTKVVMIDGSIPTTKNYFYRNLCRMIPLDQLTFLGENGWHDKFSKTRVVNKKNFEADLSQENNVKNLGKPEVKL